MSWQPHRYDPQWIVRGDSALSWNLVCRVIDPADKALILAAPELLEALELLADEQNGPPLEHRAAEWTAAMAKAEAAIKKARGEA